MRGWKAHKTEGTSGVWRFHVNNFNSKKKWPAPLRYARWLTTKHQTRGDELVWSHLECG